MLDFKIEVVYPIQYIRNAIPEHLLQKEDLLAHCRDILLFSEKRDSDFGRILVYWSLFKHPREIALITFQNAVELHNELVLAGQSSSCAIDTEIFHVIASGILAID